MQLRLIAAIVLLSSTEAAYALTTFLADEFFVNTHTTSYQWAPTDTGALTASGALAALRTAIALFACDAYGEYVSGRSRKSRLNERSAVESVSANAAASTRIFVVGTPRFLQQPVSAAACARGSVAAPYRTPGAS